MFWALQGLDRGVSSALGAVAVVIPNGFFAWRVGTTRAADAMYEARRLIAGSVAKLLIGVGILIAAFAFYRPEPKAFFATLIVVQAVHWLAPLVIRERAVAEKKSA